MLLSSMFQAARDGQLFKGRSLVMAWHKPPASQPPSTTKPSAQIAARRSTSMELLAAAGVGGEDVDATEVDAALSLDDPDVS